MKTLSIKKTINIGPSTSTVGDIDRYNDVRWEEKVPDRIYRHHESSIGPTSQHSNMEVVYIDRHYPLHSIA